MKKERPNKHKRHDSGAKEKHPPHLSIPLFLPTTTQEPPSLLAFTRKKIPIMNFVHNKYESPLSFTHDTARDDTIATQYIPIPYDHHQTLEDAVQVPSSFLYNTYSPSDNDDLWASMPPIEKEPKTYRKIWGYSVDNKEVFIWITVDGRWLCEEPDDDEEYWRIALKELPYSDAINDAD